MSDIRVDVFRFDQLFRKRLNEVRKRLRDWLAKADDDSIHDVRTAIRRLEVTCKIIPAGERSAGMEEYLGSLKQFFSGNSDIRDCDVMLARLREYGLDSHAPAMRQLLARRDRAREAMTAGAQSLAHMKMPHPPADNPDMTGCYRRQVGNLADRFLYFLPLVLEDESHGENVHNLRKAAKKLFYLLELDPRLPTMQQMVNIRSVQKLAGDIHDGDVLIAFLESRPAEEPGIGQILEAERQLRRGSYHELCELLADPAWAMLRHLGAC